MSDRRRAYLGSGQHGGVVVDDGEAGTLQPLHLMHHQIAALVVAVIRHNEPLCQQQRSGRAITESVCMYYMCVYIYRTMKNDVHWPFETLLVELKFYDYCHTHTTDT